MAGLLESEGSSIFCHGHRVDAHTDVTLSVEDMQLIEHLEV
jgi:hypothetical protein